MFLCFYIICTLWHCQFWLPIRLENLSIILGILIYTNNFISMSMMKAACCKNIENVPHLTALHYICEYVFTLILSVNVNIFTFCLYFGLFMSSFIAYFCC